MKTIEVVAAIIVRDGKVFATRRGYGKWQGWWEFPGGKIEAGESGALKVSFFMFFYSEYNVMMVDENYQIALVGSKSENFLWILSRTPVADPDLLEDVLEEAEERGYDLSKLIWVDQSRNIK